MMTTRVGLWLTFRSCYGHGCGSALPGSDESAKICGQVLSALLCETCGRNQTN